MKRFSIILFGALAILVAGCSKHAQPEPEFEPWVKDLSLPVPIQFGTPDLLTPDTKAAPITGTSDLKGKRIGVFAIDRDAADWTSPEAVLMNNVSAGCDGSKITFDPVQYYPVKSNKNYTFYGYYVYSAAVGNESAFEPTPAVDEDGYYVTLPMGNIDYLWAKAEAKQYSNLNGIHNGFNANYIREITKDEDKEVTKNHMPSFAFSHITAGVDIVVKADETESGADFSDIQICSIHVDDAVTQAKLCIAHRTEPTKGGTFVAADAVKGKIQMTAGDNNTVWLQNAGGFTPTTDGVTVGHGLFLYPGASYKVTVYYLSNATNKKWTPFEFTTAKLEAGKKYTYTLLFHSSKAIEISVSVNGWAPGSDSAMDKPMDTTK